jgi:hypothetical protein
VIKEVVFLLEEVVRVFDCEVLLMAGLGERSVQVAEVLLLRREQGLLNCFLILVHLFAFELGVARALALLLTEEHGQVFVLWVVRCQVLLELVLVWEGAVAEEAERVSRVYARSLLVPEQVRLQVARPQEFGLADVADVIVEGSLSMLRLLMVLQLVEGRVPDQTGVTEVAGVFFALLGGGVVCGLWEVLRRVGLHVGQEVALFAKGLFALFVGTHKWPLPGLQSVKNAYMESHVNLEAARAWVAFVAGTERAGEGLLPRVGEFVRLQVALGDELALADVAGEGPFSSVGAHVRLEVPGLSEFFQAALVWTNQNFRLLLGPRDFLDVLCNKSLGLRLVRCFSCGRFSCGWWRVCEELRKESLSSPFLSCTLDAAYHLFCAVPEE